MKWIEVATVDEFTTTDRKFVELSDDEQALIIHVADEAFYAVEPWCSHQKVSMQNGELEGHELMCPLHGARFDVRDGSHLCFPAVRPIKTYPLKLEQGIIKVALES